MILIGPFKKTTNCDRHVASKPNKRSEINIQICAKFMIEGNIKYMLDSMTTEMKVHRSKTLKCFFKCFSIVFQVFLKCFSSVFQVFFKCFSSVFSCFQLFFERVSPSPSM